MERSEAKEKGEWRDRGGVERESAQSERERPVGRKHQWGTECAPVSGKGVSKEDVGLVEHEMVRNGKVRERMGRGRKVRREEEEVIRESQVQKAPQTRE